MSRISNIDPKEYMRYGKWSNGTYFNGLFLKYEQKELFKKILGINFTYHSFVSLDDSYFTYISDFEKLTNIVKQNPMKFLDDWGTKCEQEINRIINNKPTYSNLKEKSDEELHKLIQEFEDYIGPLFVFLNTYVFAAMIIEEKLVKEIPDLKFEEVRPIKKMSYEILNDELVDAKTEEDFKKLKDEYGWYGICLLRHKPITIEELKELKTRAKKTQIPEPSNDKIIRALQKYMWVKFERIDTFNKALYWAFPLFEEVMNRIQLDFKYWETFMPDELSKALLTKKIPENLNDRFQYRGFIKINGTSFFLTKSEINELQEKFKFEEKNELKGRVACKGIAVGPACVVDKPEQMKKVSKGDILVTAETLVEHEPYMHQVNGMIIEMNTLLCHSAIFAREFNIPTIVGVLDATKNIKDGEYVKVDAKNGEVIKITKQEYNKLKPIHKKEQKKENKQEKMTNNEYKFREDHILWFKDLSKQDIPLVGGKGANLGEMFNKFNIPNGFCVTVNAYKRFLDETQIGAHIHGLLDELDIEQTEQLDKTSEEIRNLILKQEFPDDLHKEIMENYSKLKGKVAVRSSATAEDLPTASFAGQQDTYLNVEENDIMKSVQKCWASLFTSRAIYYREKNNFKHRDVLISVVIQKMIDAKYASVMFTVDPVNKKHILVEIVEGLGEALVSGHVTPNTYFMNKQSHKVEEAMEHFSIDHKYVEEISQIGEEIEKHYGIPMDVELAFDEHDELFVLQARPITTL